MTFFDRRSFLKTSCLAACASALEAARAAAAVATARWTRVLAAPLPLSAPEKEVLAFAGQYSSRVRLAGLGVLLKLRGTPTREAHLLVEVSDPGKFDAALEGRTPFGGAYSEGNAILFVRGGIEFTVENLVPTAFAQRLTELATLKKIAFAYDALIYDPATQNLTDPFGAEKSQVLKMVNSTIAGGGAIDTAMRGRLASGRLGLNPDFRFKSWQAHHLGLAASTRSAQAVAEAFLGKLASIAETFTPDAMKSLLRSRAVSTALKRVFGINVADVIAEFDRRRSEVVGAFSDGALWLALLLGPEVESNAADGAAITWLQRGTWFEVQRSRKALAQAQTLAADSAF